MVSALDTTLVNEVAPDDRVASHKYLPLSFTYSSPHLPDDPDRDGWRACRSSSRRAHETRGYLRFQKIATQLVDWDDAPTPAYPELAGELFSGSHLIDPLHIIGYRSGHAGRKLHASVGINAAENGLGVSTPWK